MTEKTKTQTAKDALSDSTDKTRATLDEAKERVQRASTFVREEAGRATEFARERYDVASENLREGYGKARKDLDRLSDDVTTYVRDNPGRSVLIAGALGFFLGLLIRGDRRR